MSRQSMKKSNTISIDPPTPGSPDADRFDLLTLVVDDYERIHWPMQPPDPIVAIRYGMETRGLTQADLGRLLGSKAARLGYSVSAPAAHHAHGLEASPRLGNSGRSADQTHSIEGQAGRPPRRVGSRGRLFSLNKSSSSASRFPSCCARKGGAAVRPVRHAPYEIAADDFRLGIVGALEQDVRGDVLISASGVSSAKGTTRSTKRSAARTDARVARSCTGRPGPFSRAARGVAVDADDQPVDAARRLFERVEMAAVEEVEAAIGEADLEALALQSATCRRRRALGDARRARAPSAWRSSPGCTVAVPGLVTAMPAAALARRTASASGCRPRAPRRASR